MWPDKLIDYMFQTGLQQVLQIDRGTRGPTSYAETIGKAIETCEHLPICKFQSIKNYNFPSANIEDLSTDQKLLIKFCKVIQKENVQNT